MKFEVSEEQVEKYKEWRKHCNTEAGAIGGKTSFCFTRTGLGDVLVLKCISNT